MSALCFSWALPRLRGDWYDLFVPSDTVASLFLGSLGRAPPRLQSAMVGRLPGRAAVELLALVIRV